MAGDYSSRSVCEARAERSPGKEGEGEGHKGKEKALLGLFLLVEGLLSAPPAAEEKVLSDMSSTAAFENPLADHPKYVTQKYLSEGSFGFVLLAKERATGKKVLILIHYWANLHASSPHPAQCSSYWVAGGHKVHGKDGGESVRPSCLFVQGVWHDCSLS